MPTLLHRVLLHSLIALSDKMLRKIRAITFMENHAGEGDDTASFQVSQQIGTCA